MKTNYIVVKEVTQFKYSGTEMVQRSGTKWKNL